MLDAASHPPVDLVDPDEDLADEETASIRRVTDEDNVVRKGLRKGLRNWFRRPAGAGIHVVDRLY
jgi:hypothetical protein